MGKLAILGEAMQCILVVGRKVEGSFMSALIYARGGVHYILKEEVPGALDHKAE
jgi:hypothetical protein